MEEQIGIARWITVSHPDRSVSPPYSQGRAATFIKKAVLHGIKRGAKLALKGHLPASFCVGPASAGDVPFAIPKLSKDEVHCTFCRKDFPSAKAVRRHLRMHEGKSVYVCSKCGRHLAGWATMKMHQHSCGSQDCLHNCVTCGKGYHSKQALLQHLKVHHPPASVEDRTCPDCKQVFNLVKTMREHRVMHRGAFSMPSGGLPFSVCQNIITVTSGRNMASTQEEINAFKTIQQVWSLAGFVWSLAQ